MNPMLLKTDSSFNDCKTVSKYNHGKFKTKGDFLSHILTSLGRDRKTLFQKHHHHQLKGMSSDTEGPRFYLESFRNALLATGKPLDKISLTTEDLPLLKKFLLQSGGSEEKAENMLNELKINSRDGEINLASFFQNIGELDLRKQTEKNDKQTCMIESSAIPHMESVLRNFGLPPRELDTVFSAAKVNGGGLDPKMVAIKLKQISNRLSDKIQTIKDQDTVKQISNKMETMGLNLPDKAKAGKISIEDFITSLEQMTKGQGKENSQSPELKSTMDRLLERVIISGEKQNIVVSPQADANVKLHNHIAKQKLNEEGESIDKGSLLANLNEESENTNHMGRQRIEDSHHAKKIDLFPNSTDSKGFQNKTGKGVQDLKSETRIMESSQQSTVSNFSDSMNAVENNDTSLKAPLPTYLIDQVGKQISRSILRGDRIVRLQLKPPELGRVKISIDIKDNVLKLGMIAEHSSVKELLLSNAHELREALVSQGIKLENIDIQINAGFGQSMAGSKEWINEGKRWNQNSGMESFHSDNNEEVLQSEPMKTAAGGSLLNLVA
jgi:flagellar hook-length control protein FliK